MTDLMRRHIQEVSLTSNQPYPYAPYLMYIIEQVTRFGFHHDATHDWSVRHLQAKTSKGKESATDASGSGAAQEQGPLVTDDEQDVPPMDRPCGASGEHVGGHGHSHGGGRVGATRHALQKFMSFFCYCQAKQDRCMRRLEEKAGLSPTSPL